MTSLSAKNVCVKHRTHFSYLQLDVNGIFLATPYSNVSLQAMTERTRGQDWQHKECSQNCNTGTSAWHGKMCLKKVYFNDAIDGPDLYLSALLSALLSASRTPGFCYHIFFWGHIKDSHGTVAGENCNSKRTWSQLISFPVPVEVLSAPSLFDVTVLRGVEIFIYF